MEKFRDKLRYIAIVLLCLINLGFGLLAAAADGAGGHGRPGLRGHGRHARRVRGRDGGIGPIATARIKETGP